MIFTLLGYIIGRHFDRKPYYASQHRFWFMNPLHVVPDKPLSEALRCIVMTALWLLPVLALTGTGGGFFILAYVFLILRQGVYAFMGSWQGDRGVDACVAAEASFYAASALHKAAQREQQARAQATADAFYDAQLRAANNPYSMNAPR